MLSKLRNYQFNQHPLLWGFLIGFVIRGIAEIAIGRFPIGYDTSTFYIYACVCEDWDYIIRAPLYSLFLLALYKMLGNALLAVKLGSAIITGIFTLSLTIWGLKDNCIKKSFLFSFVFFIFTFWISLRLDWDLHRNLLSLSLAIIAIALREEQPKIAEASVFLAGLAHPFSIIFVIGGLFTHLLRKEKLAFRLLLLNLIGVSIVVISAYFLISYPVGSIIQDKTWFVNKDLLIIYFLWIYLPIWIVWAVLYYLHKSQFIKFIKGSWKEIFWILIILLSTITLKFGYRLAFLAFFPILLTTFSFINKNYKKKAIWLFITYNIIVSAVFPLVFYLYPIHPTFRKTHPAVLLGGNMFPGDDERAVYLLKEASKLINDRVKLVVHHSEIAYVYAAGIDLCDSSIIIMRPDTSFGYVISRLYKNQSLDTILIVWYIQPPSGVEKLPYNPTILIRNDTLALFVYYLNETRILPSHSS